MAQICGVQNHQRPSSTGPIITATTTIGGIELMLHELDPPDINSSSSTSFHSSAKKRGRPRKDSLAANVSAQSSFDDSPSKKEDEKRLKRERKRLLKLEQKKEKKMKKILRQQLDDDDNENNCFLVPKKRGRPRKQSELDQCEDLDNLVKLPSFSNADTLTPIYSEISETDSVINDNCTNNRGNGNSNKNVEFSMMEILNLNHEDEVKLNEVETIETKWTPIQRLTQLNQALAFTSMYKDVIFWDRIVAEFTHHSLLFRLELGKEKSFDIPFLVLSKFFWVCAQLGLQRTQFLFTGLSEKFDDDADQGGVLFNSSESIIYSHMCNDKIMISQRANQLIKFDSSAKISEWTIKINKHDEFFKTIHSSDAKDVEELTWGFPKKAIEFLDVALVMSSVLTDAVSWLTWFYTYIQQSGLKNFSIVELSRPPSPFQFPSSSSAALSSSYDDQPVVGLSDLAVGMEFFEKGREFIFNVLNNANMDTAVSMESIPEEFSLFQNLEDNTRIKHEFDSQEQQGQIYNELDYCVQRIEQTYDNILYEQTNEKVYEEQQKHERYEYVTAYDEQTEESISESEQQFIEPIAPIEPIVEDFIFCPEPESSDHSEPRDDESLEVVISENEESDDFFDSYN